METQTEKKMKSGHKEYASYLEAVMGTISQSASHSVSGGSHQESYISGTSHHQVSSALSERKLVFLVMHNNQAP